MQQQYLTVTEEQTVFIRMSSRTYKVRFYPFRGLMYTDISVGEEYLVAGQRVMVNTWLLADYMVGESGNFRFEAYKSDGDDYVWWEGFNVKFRLCCYSKQEIENMQTEQENTES